MGVELDTNLVQHIAFLFSRDALVIFKDRVDTTEETTEHFENL